MALRLDKSQLADLLDVTTRTISDWQRDPDFPAPAKSGRCNTYDATAVVQWWRDREIGRLIDDDSGEVLDLQQEKARLARVQRERQSLLLSRERGEVAAVAEVADAVGEEYDRVRTRLLAAPVKLAPLVAMLSDIGECRSIIERSVHEALTELSAPDAIGEASSSA